ncbi:TadE/TadG family type IV pilus assembly protein [Streptomyces sp. t39]|uniref:TadE/TadG family type IV pilus assembly protein n=1 Tax=Streptomyces sp. t39 TaxID=1828156 RepID=UPI0011CD681A|nr:TadE/TadG family type IV pilus assembly protein [Streptomyces sp. t39]TXS56680.1 pilus assembly protein [Streptomyces sp. t39]
MSVRGRDRGQVSLEFTGFLPLLLLLALGAVQLGIAAYATVQAGTAARAAARADGDDDWRTHSAQAGRASVSGWLTDAPGDYLHTSRSGGKEVTSTVRIRIPSVVPFIDDWGYAERSSTMPKD